MDNKSLEILEKLISFQSVTPKGADAIEYVAKFLSELGFSCDIKKFGPPEEEVTNLYAAFGDSAPNICFAGHLDVVPPMNEELWHSDPFKMRTQDDNVYGRGAVDMKGAIACAMSAVSKFINNGGKQEGAISFLLTTDEEGPGTYGTKAMLEHIKDKKIDFCILGEPTSKRVVGDTIKIGRRGSVNFALKVNGKQGHVAYPEKAINPMPAMVAILAELCAVELDDGSKYFQKSNLEVTSVDVGNDVSNIIPESVSSKFNIRFNDHHSSKELSAMVVEVASKYSDDYDLQYSCSSEPFIQQYSDNMQKFTKIVEGVCNVSPAVETSGGTSDARFIHRFSEVVEFGLNCDLAHKINEHTKISDLQTLHNVYYSCLNEFLRG